jgi:enamine deaminase RidA (YjgF/YER057c/UK114 family)
MAALAVQYGPSPAATKGFRVPIARHLPSDKLSRAVVSDGCVYIAGTTAADAAPDAKGQTAALLAKIDKALAAAGSDKSRLLSANVFVSDMRVKPGMDEAWLAWVDPKNLPARATVETLLGSPQTLVEIMVIAAPAVQQGASSMSNIVRTNPMGKLCDMVEHNGVLYLAGQVSEDLKLDAKGQTENILKQIDDLLKGAGSSKSKLLSATVYVNDMRDKPKMDEAWLKWIDTKNLPARATVEARLGSPDTLVEIMCIAAK